MPNEPNGDSLGPPTIDLMIPPNSDSVDVIMDIPNSETTPPSIRPESPKEDLFRQAGQTQNSSTTSTTWSPNNTYK